jgi:hypothetical protein
LFAHEQIEELEQMLSIQQGVFRSHLDKERAALSGLSAASGTVCNLTGFAYSNL